MSTNKKQQNANNCRIACVMTLSVGLVLYPSSVAARQTLAYWDEYQAMEQLVALSTNQVLPEVMPVELQPSQEIDLIDRLLLTQDQNAELKGWLITPQSHHFSTDPASTVVEPDIGLEQIATGFEEIENIVELEVDVATEPDIAETQDYSPDEPSPPEEFEQEDQLLLREEELEDELEEEFEDEPEEDEPEEDEPDEDVGTADD